MYVCAGYSSKEVAYIMRKKRMMMRWKHIHTLLRANDRRSKNDPRAKGKMLVSIHLLRFELRMLDSKSRVITTSL
jgi:hypothetical protein